MQEPQLAVRALPQLSVPETEPQFAPWATQKEESGSGVHPQTFGVPPPPQVCGAEHAPQFRTSLQPSEISPQLTPAFVHVVGVQVPTPHTFGMPPAPHVWPPGHAPQERTTPHAAVTTGSRPQFFPREPHVAALQLVGPWQVPAVQCRLSAEQSAQLSPPVPQLASSEPARQRPSAVQQPAHVLGKQGWDVRSVRQPAAAAATRTRLKRRLNIRFEFPRDP